MLHNDSVPPLVRSRAGDQGAELETGFLVPFEIARRDDLDDDEKLLFSLIRFRAGVTGQCWWSHVKLGKQLGKSKSTIQRKATQLVEKGLLECHKDPNRRTLTYSLPDRPTCGSMIDPAGSRTDSCTGRTDPTVGRGATQLVGRRKKTLSENQREKQHDNRARVVAIFNTVVSEHPHVPDADLALRFWKQRFGEDVAATEAALRQHRESWQPLWAAGQYPPALHRWIKSYNPVAKIAPRREPQSLRATQEQLLQEAQ